MDRSIASLYEVVKSYGTHKVLNRITLEINRGELLGLIGPSGSGKTTTIKCLLGMENFDSGSAEIFKQKIPNRQVLNKIGYMGQTDALYENLTAYENLDFFGHLSELKGKELEDNIKKNMSLVDLENTLNKKVNQFSGGMKRRLSLAMALLGQPDLIILDEPTVGIDPKLRNQIWTQLKNIVDKGKSVVVTTHVMDEAERCDKVGLIIEGRLFALDTPKNLKKKFNTDTIEEGFIKAEEASLS